MNVRKRTKRPNLARGVSSPRSLPLAPTGSQQRHVITTIADRRERGIYITNTADRLDPSTDAGRRDGFAPIRLAPHDRYRCPLAAPRLAGRVAEDYDALHLTVVGWLTSAGRPLAVGEEWMRVLAGWDPDQTHRLTDITIDEPTGEPWERDLDDGWTKTRTP